MNNLNMDEFNLFRKFNTSHGLQFKKDTYLYNEKESYEEMLSKMLLNNRKLFNDAMNININKTYRDCNDCNLNDGITIIMKATHKCNLSCPYCYDLKNRTSECYNQDIELDTVNNILKIFNKQIRTIIWHGGEPLIVPVDKMDMINETIKAYNSDIQILIQSNGTLINQKTIDMFNKYGIRPGLSFDGIKNEFTRKNTAKLMHVFKLLKQNNMTFGSILVLTPENIKDIIAEYEYFKLLKTNVMMNLVFLAEDNDNSLNMDADIMKKYICEFFNYWITDKFNPANSQLCITYLDMLLDTGNKFCANGNCVGRWFGIHPNGDIQPCGRDWDENMTFGNVNEIESIDDVLNHPNFINFKSKTQSLTDNCNKNCEFAYCCNGGCYGNVHSVDKEFSRPEKNYCEATKYILTHIFNRIKNIDPNDIDQAKKYNPLFINYLISSNFKNMNLIKKVLKLKEENKS